MSSKERVFKISDKIIDRYTNAEHEWRSMLAFIRENHKDCSELSKEVPKYLIKRYSLSYEYRQVGLAWYLLDEYFKGNITIKEDVQSIK